jgi:hypothetical protein
MFSRYKELPIKEKLSSKVARGVRRSEAYSFRCSSHFDKYGQNLSKTAEALKVAGNTVRRYLSLMLFRLAICRRLFKCE